MLNPRVIASIALVGLGIGVMYWIEGLSGMLVGSFFFIAALSLWTLPSGIFHRGQGRLDPSQQRISNVLLGTGLGLLGGVVAAVLLPPQWFLVLSLVVVIVVGVWWFRQS
jgi:hypothetical protein